MATLVKVRDFVCAVGDTVRVVRTQVVEHDKKKRTQIFAGVVTGIRGKGPNETFTVRRLSYGEGVERSFPLHPTRVDKVEVERQGQVRRAQLTYLRQRLGKGASMAGGGTTISASETRLLRRINAGPPAGLFEEFRQLVEQRRRQGLSPAEEDRMAKVLARLDAYEGRRLSWLTALAKLRQTTVRELILSLGLERPAHV